MSVEEVRAATASEPQATSERKPASVLTPAANGANRNSHEQGMARESRLRGAVIFYFPMFIATLSLVLSIYQGYLFHASIEIMQKNVARGEYIRTCREIIETYFLVKQKIGVLMPAADRGNVAGASRLSENNRLEAQVAVAKFGGLGTYLANFQDAGTRARYTDLTRTLTAIIEQSRTTPLPEIDKLFEPADKLFSAMNDDCVALARAMRM